MDDAQQTSEREVTELRADLNALLLFTKDLNAHQIEEYWVVQVPVGLLFEVWRIQAELGAAVTQGNIPNLAFLCRQSLEMHVWARYVASSTLAAKRFHQDAYVDGLEVFRLLDKVFLALDQGWHSVLRAATDSLVPEFERVLSRDKVGLTMNKLRTMKHLNIAQTAAEVGYGQMFALWNPLLSKLVHATAYNVLVAGKGMDGIGRFLVRGVAWELRETVKHVEVYLRSNNLPLYGSR
jgi:hypothetical protein